MRFSIAIPISMTLIIVSIAIDAQNQSDTSGSKKFLGQAKCEPCHRTENIGAQWMIWSKSRHRLAFETLKSPEAIAVGKSLGLDQAPAEAPECLRCHVTSYDVETNFVDPDIAMEDGVQCESCHGTVSPEHQTWAFAYRQGRAAPDAERGVRLATRADCLKCHNEESPTWDPARYTDRNGNPVGFDFSEAFEKISHYRPEEEAEE